MSWFGKRANAERETAEAIKRAEKETREVCGPPGDLVATVVLAGQSVRRDLTPVFGYAAGTPSEAEILLFFESLYFVSHMVLRFAVRERFKDEQISKLQAFIGPLLAATAADAFFAHWPEDKKIGIRRDFIARLNDAEREYSACRKLASEDEPFGTDSLFGLVSRNVCALNERGDDMSALTATIQSFMSAYSEMVLADRMPAVRAVIDRLDPKELAAFSQGTEQDIAAVERGTL